MIFPDYMAHMKMLWFIHKLKRYFDLFDRLDGVDKPVHL